MKDIGIDPGSAVDVLGDHLVNRLTQLTHEACRKAASDPEPMAGLAALVEMYIQFLASVVVFAYPQEMRATAVAEVGRTLKAMVLEEMKNEASIWVQK